MISVIVPIFNESQNIILIYGSLTAVLNKLGVDFEIIFVNDGSKDDSFTIIKFIASKDNKVKYINLSKNFGHQIAVTAGLENCIGQYAVIIDADLQDPPEVIIELYNKCITENCNVVYAKRKKREGESYFKLFTAKLFYKLLASITNTNIPLDTGDFRIIDRKVLDVIKNMPEKNKFLRGQIAWAGFKQDFVEYDRDKRTFGKTGYPLKKMIKFALDGIISFSDFPLKLATFSGFVVSFFSFLLILYSLYSRFITKVYVPGWTSIMISVLFVGGIQLLCVGIIGEYVSRILVNVQNRPLYIVDETNIKI